MTKVSKLTGPKLAEWTARAQKWAVKDDWFLGNRMPMWVNERGVMEAPVELYMPHTNGAQAMELVEKYYIHLSTDLMCEWIAGYRSKEDGRMRWNNHGKTPMEAVCRAVVASVYGEEVEDECL